MSFNKALLKLTAYLNAYYFEGSNKSKKKPLKGALKHIKSDYLFILKAFI